MEFLKGQEIMDLEGRDKLNGTFYSMLGSVIYAIDSERRLLMIDLLKDKHLLWIFC